MGNFTFKGLFLAGLFMVLGCLSIQAADDDGLITKQITIKLEKAGTLPDKIGSTKKYQITNLKIIGEINGTDLMFIRNMAGGIDFYDETGQGKLSVLDLSQARIVVGGGPYFIIDIVKVVLKVLENFMLTKMMFWEIICFLVAVL